MKKYDRYFLENQLVFKCDWLERSKHINKLELMKTREDQDEYIELYSDEIKVEVK